MLADMLRVLKYHLGNDGTPAERALFIEIRNIPNDEVVAVESDSKPLLDQAFNIVVMTDQFLKH